MIKQLQNDFPAENSADSVKLKKWDRPLVYANIFMLFMLVYEFFYFPGLHIWYFTQLFPARLLSTRIIDLLGLALGIFIFTIFSYLAFASRKLYRFFFGLSFGLLLLIQYGYANAVNRFISIRDLNTAVSYPTELWLYSINAFFDWHALIPWAVFIFFLLLTVRENLYGWKQPLILLVAATMVLSFYQYWDEDVLPFFTPVLFLKEMTELFWHNPFAEPDYRRTELAWQVSDQPDNNVILIIDESIRGDHLSVNGYERPTTPYLDELNAEGFIYNWGIAAAAATCSVESNRVMITGLNKLPDSEERIYQNPLIFQYAQAMGYQTYHFDVQTSFFWNGVNVADSQYIDHWVNRDTITHEINGDLRVAEMVNEVIGESTGNFIVINKKGVHFPYFRSFPEDEAIWTPIVADSTYNNYELLKNTYDNGLVYAVDRFFRVLIPDSALLQNTAIIYTSDHGQTLSEHGETWFHCESTHNEAVVPLLLITAADLSVDTAYKASHFNVFATLLDLMGVPPEQRALDYAPSLLTATWADSTERYYLPGNADFFDGEVINFDQ